MSARVVLVARSWGRSDASRVVFNVALCFVSIFARELVAVSRVVVAHGSRTAVRRSGARITECVAHVQACRGSRRSVGRSAMSESVGVVRSPVLSITMRWVEDECRQNRSDDETKMDAARDYLVAIWKVLDAIFRALRTVAKRSDGRLRSTSGMESTWVPEEAACCAFVGSVDEDVPSR